ncbi:HupE/UreJ family protein [Paenibacillus aceris]|nr:HupE/UreJ family protein [Paenibacillus aceris]
MTILIAFLLYAFSSHASAHALSASYTTIAFEQDKTGFTFSLDVLSVIESMDVDANKNGLLDADELEKNKHRLEEWIDDSLVLEKDGREQKAELTDLKLGKKGDKEVLTWELTYPAFAPGQTISINDGLYAGPSDSAYVNLLTSRHGNQVSETVLQGKNRTWTTLLAEEQQQQQQQQQPAPSTSAGTAQVDQPLQQTQQAQTSNQGTVSSADPATSSWFSFFKLGINHILTGYDHMLFLLALLLRKQSFKQYASIITAFTLAHSITLTLAVLGFISLPSRIVESVIALSICYVALENMFRKELRNRWIVTFLFGLIHGIGFSDILREMNLPKSHLAVDLISFNVGIECIQLCLVLVLLPILIFLQKKSFFRSTINIGSLVITALGGIWLVERMFF